MSRRREKRKKKEIEREEERSDPRKNVREPRSRRMGRFQLLSILSIMPGIVTDSGEPPRFTGHGTFVFLPTANPLYFSVSLPTRLERAVSRLRAVRRVLKHDVVDTTKRTTRSGDRDAFLASDQRHDRISAISRKPAMDNCSALIITRILDLVVEQPGL